ncbi:MAG: hypothetical protein QN157_09095 [Armatimonadota bacterium]|nr:hypothetical protein [Armatimonadota bacterium]
MQLGLTAALCAARPGPDLRTRILHDTSAVLFGAWCPGDVPVDAVRAHVAELTRLARREWSEAAIEAPVVLEAARAGSQDC